MSLRDLNKQLHKSKKVPLRHSKTAYNEWQSDENAYKIEKDHWTKEVKNNAKNKIKAVTIALVALGIIILFSVVSLIYYNHQLDLFSEERVSMDVIVPKEIKSNKPVEIVINYKNDNEASLKNAEISVAYGNYFIPEEKQKYFKKATNNSGTIALGDVGPKTNGRVVIIGRFFAPRNESEVINFDLKYIPENKHKEYRLRTSASIKVTSFPVDLSIITEKEAVNGNIVDIVVHYENKSKSKLEDAILEVDYPEGFGVFDMDPKSVSGVNNKWKIGNLNPGDKGVIKIRGSVNSNKSIMKFVARIFESKNTSLLFGENYYVIKIVKSPLTISNKAVLPKRNTVEYNGVGGVFVGSIDNVLLEKIGFFEKKREVVDNVMYPGDDVDFVINIKNNGTTAYKDLIVTAEVSGDVVDYDSLKVSSGYFDSNKKIIVWKASDVPKLKLLRPGESVSIDYSVHVKEFLPKGKGNLSFSSVAYVDSLDLPTHIKENKTIASNKVIVKVGVKYLFEKDVKFIRKDEDGRNIYRVTLRVGSVNNNLLKVYVRGVFPTYVEFLDYYGDNIGEFKVNKRANIFVWNIGTIQFGSGVTKPFKEVSFDLKLLNKDVVDVNRLDFIVKKLFGEGIDEFTNERIFFN